MAFLIGCISVLASAVSGAFAVLRSLPSDDRWRWSRLSVDVRLQLLVMAIAGVASLAVLYQQDRSKVEAESKFSQLREDQSRLFQILYKQETIRELSLRISPHRCWTNDEVRKGGFSSAEPYNLTELYYFLAGRKLGEEQTFAAQFHVYYGPIWVVVTGQAGKGGQRWFYALGTDVVNAARPLGSEEFPKYPNRLDPIDLVDLRLGEDALRRFLPHPPQVYRFLANSGYTDTFDPRSELGSTQVVWAVVADRQMDILRQAPPEGDWTLVPIPFDFFKCWDTTLSINDRPIVSFTEAGGLMEAQRQRFLNWPGNMLRAELRKGHAWLAPMPYAWREFRPVMNCRVAWLLYADSKAPCEGGGSKRSP